MRLFLMALPFWLWGLSFGTVLSQEQAPVQPAGEPWWIVVYRLPSQEQAEGTPFVEWRVVVRAENDLNAVMRSVLFVKNTLNLPDYLQRSLKLVEVVAKKPDSIPVPNK